MPLNHELQRQIEAAIDSDEPVEEPSQLDRIEGRLHSIDRGITLLLILTALALLVLVVSASRQ